MGWVWLGFAAFAGIFVTGVIVWVIEWADRPPPSSLQAQLEVWRRIVKARHDA